MSPCRYSSTLIMYPGLPDYIIEERQDIIFRRVRGILNKITPETFDKLSKELVNVGLDSPRTLRGVIYLLFDKALKDLKYSSLYAKLCQELSEKAPNFEQEPGPNTFCKFLISKCEDEFERRRKATEDFDRKHELTDEEYEQKAIAKLKMLGNIKFICELGKKRLLQEEILHECIRGLLSKKKERPIQDQAQDLECLCQIMKTIGSLLDIQASRNLMNQYFERIYMFSEKSELPSRIRFMLRDVIDLRNNNWRPKPFQREDNIPQPLSKLREEAGYDLATNSSIEKLGNSRNLIGISDLSRLHGNKLSLLLNDDEPSFTTTTDFHWGPSYLHLDQSYDIFSNPTQKSTSSVTKTTPASTNVVNNNNNSRGSSNNYSTSTSISTNPQSSITLPTPATTTASVVPSNHSIIMPNPIIKSPNNHHDYRFEPSKNDGIQRLDRNRRPHHIDHYDHKMRQSKFLSNSGYRPARLVDRRPQPSPPPHPPPPHQYLQHQSHQPFQPPQQQPPPPSASAHLNRKQLYFEKSNQPDSKIDSNWRNPNNNSASNTMNNHNNDPLPIDHNTSQMPRPSNVMRLNDQPHEIKKLGPMPQDFRDRRPYHPDQHGHQSRQPRFSGMSGYRQARPTDRGLHHHNHHHQHYHQPPPPLQPPYQQQQQPQFRERHYFDKHNHFEPEMDSNWRAGANSSSHPMNNNHSNNNNSNGNSTITGISNNANNDNNSNNNIIINNNNNAPSSNQNSNSVQRPFITQRSNNQIIETRKFPADKSNSNSGSSSCKQQNASIQFNDTRLPHDGNQVIDRRPILDGVVAFASNRIERDSSNRNIRVSQPNNSILGHHQNLLKSRNLDGPTEPNRFIDPKQPQLSQTPNSSPSRSVPKAPPKVIDPNFSLRPSHNLVGRSIVSTQNKLNSTTPQQGTTISNQKDELRTINDGNITNINKGINNNSNIITNNDNNRSNNNNDVTSLHRVAARDFHVKKFDSVLEEFINDSSPDLSKTTSKIKELKIPKNYQHECLVAAIKQSILKAEAARVNVGKLMVLLLPSIFEQASLLAAFKIIFEQLHVLEVETPKVKSLVAALLSQAISDNLMSLEDLGYILSGGKHHPLFLLVLQKLQNTAGQTWLNEKFISSKINLIDMLPEVDRSKDRLASALKDRCLGFLDPMLTIEPDLYDQMKDCDGSPAIVYRWIKDHVDQTILNTPTFAHVLLSCLLKYVHNVASEKYKIPMQQKQQHQATNQEADSSSSNKSSPTAATANTGDIEKEMLTKYQKVLQAILKGKQLQLAALYALQSFYHGLDFPKGSLLRWFHMLYDLNIVDDDVFFTWKEEINDEFPGKGQALFQVNTWLNWLAESEDEDEEEV